MVVNGEVRIMKILITGCKGQLGTEIQKQLRLGYSEIGSIPESLVGSSVTAIDLDTLDLSDLSGVKSFVGDLCPDIIINCAAYTNVDGCETNRDTAFAANAIGPRNLAIAAEKCGAKLIHVSTDYVFDGKDNGSVPRDECDIPNPISAYGSTKLLGERYVSTFCSRHFIVRTAWLYSYYGKNFVKTMLNLAASHPYLEVVNDQCGNPTNAVDLANELLQLAATEQYGLYHCTGEGVCSWYDFACAIMQEANTCIEVRPISSAEYKKKFPKSADRPAWSALDNRMLRCTIGNDMRSWKDALHTFFEHWDGANGTREETK